MSLIPYSSHIVFFDKPKYNFKYPNNIITNAFYKGVKAAIDISDSRSLFEDMMLNMSVEVSGNIYNFFLGVPKTKYLIDLIYKNIFIDKIASVEGKLDKTKYNEYIQSLKDRITIQPFSIHLDGLFKNTKYKDKKKQWRVDYKHVAMMLATYNITTNPDTLTIIHEMTNDYAKSGAYEDMASIVNGLYGVETKLKVAEDLSPKEQRYRTYIQECKGDIDCIIEKINSHVIEKDAVDIAFESAFLNEKDDDEVIDQDLFVAQKKYDILTKFAYLERLSSGIQDSKNMLLSLVLVRPNDTKPIRVVKRIIGITIGSIIILLVPVIIYSFFYFTLLNMYTTGYLLSAILLLVVVKTIIKQLDV